MRLQGALDNDVHIAVTRFIGQGVTADVPSLYTALQRSNSSLKRMQKRVLEASIERVLNFIETETQDTNDPDAMIEDTTPDRNTVAADLMNRSLRANLASRPNVAPTSSTNGDEPVRKRKTNGEPDAKRPKRDDGGKISLTPPEGVSMHDIGGMNSVLEQLEELVVDPLQSSEMYTEQNLAPPKGVLLHGPPGCGKTMIVRAIAARLQMPFIEILGPSIVSGMSGESEKGLRERFEQAQKSAPCLIFIDEIDSIAPKRESSQSQMEKRIVAQLLGSMDKLHSDPTKPVVIVAATNRPDSIDPALRRGGRFGSEINIPVPDEQGRQRILVKQTSRVPLADNVDFGLLAKMTAGFVGADLHQLVGKAGVHKRRNYRQALKQEALDMNLVPGDDPSHTDAAWAIDRYIERTNRRDLPRPPGFENMALGMEDFLAVLPDIIPSSKREGFATVPEVSWNDIGALDSIREALQIAIVNPIKRPELYEALGMQAPSGVLLWGPPGCGKTLLAKAVAAESRANFISIKGPELLNKFVGESEAAVRKVFARARSSVPCVIFFDELDALAPRREDSSSEASSRVVNTLLTELDGLSIRTGIYVVAATNRPDIIDEAMLRPGRLETPLFVDLPGPEERVEILKTILRNRPCEFTPEIGEISRNDCEGFSGADLTALVRKAGESVMKREGKQYELQDFVYAAANTKGSVQDANKYRRLKVKFAQV